MESQKPDEGYTSDPGLPAQRWWGMGKKEVKPILLRFFYLFFLVVSFIAAKSLRDGCHLFGHLRGYGALAGGVMMRWMISFFPGQGLCPRKTVTRPPLRVSEAMPIIKSRYLRKIFAILSLVAVTAIFVEYQFNVFVEKTYQTAAEMASFFGTFYLVLSVTALLIQFFITRTFLKKTGLFAILVLLPFGLMAGGLALILVPVLGAALIMRLWDGGIRHSLYRTAAELLYLPLTEMEKVRSKILLDTFAPKVAEGFAGLLLLVGTRIFHLPQAVFSATVVFFSFLGVVIGLSMRKEYAEKLKENLEVGRNELAVARIDFSDQTTLTTVALYLNSPDSSKVVNVPDELLLQIDDQVKIEMIRSLNETGRIHY